MKKLSKGFVINLITWVLILGAAAFAVYAFNKFIAAKSAPVIYPAQKIAAAKNISAANAMPEQSSVVQNDNIAGNIDNGKELPNEKPEQTESEPEAPQKFSSYTYSDYEAICKDSYDEESKKYIFKQYYEQDMPFEEGGIKYKNIFYAAAQKKDESLLKCLLEGTQKTVKVFNEDAKGKNLKS
ncbi:MAG: hypothetical protein LBQ47_02515 [Endomicrobium sp.]|jgi:hypothetical protein|nr:hypothetical protein [Endomicrobium sp.]